MSFVPASVLTAILTAIHHYPHPYPHPPSLITSAGPHGVVSPHRYPTPILTPWPSPPVLVPASIRTAVLTPILTSSPPVPHHQCWSSRRRVIRPRLYLTGILTPILTPWPSPPVLVVTSCHSSPLLSSPVSSPLSSPPGPHTTSAGRHRAVVSFVPASILTAILTTILTAVLTPRPSPRVLATAPREYRRCTSSSHRAVVVSPRSPPPVRCDHACRPACVFVVVAPREFGVAPRVLHARASKQATWKNTS